MEVSQERSRVRSTKLLNCGVNSKVRAVIIGIFIYCAFYLIEMGMFTHRKTAAFTSSESVTLKVKLNEDDVIVESDTINIDSSFEMASLFDHEVPLVEVNCEDILLRDKSVTLVISHCHHPLHWVAEFLNGFEELIDEVWVFTKCDMDVVGAPNGSNIIKLPNVGGCDHTIARALQIYSGLPRNSENDMVVFLKDNFEISKNFLE
eukprot:CAMPEP_0172419734 /NCGR_PEP_ID=MMETSP1064-20121228/6137_1 /TAXON_ID=202472 /ORGANISM="Aulacoseira subarctica , Strain CCAP 1002/5" /LENGTH=204 /DNA_ID=CAMNT_0013159347 /DNA_START=33 /DNA_END=647 /DNA_ORIENTATION=-